MLLPDIARAVTPAGTQIQATSDAQYYSSSGSSMPTSSSNATTVTVGQVAAVTASPASDTRYADPGVPVAFPVSVANMGNGSDAFSLTAAPQNGSSVSVYKDDNGDGQRQSTETTQVATTGALAMGGVFKCFVVAQSSSTSAADIVAFTARSQFDINKSAVSTLTVKDNAASTSTYIRSWLLNGYYPNGSKATLMSTDYLGGEADVTPLEGSTSGGKTWFRADSSTDLIDLAAIFNNPTYCAAYACAYVYSSTARTVNMWMGSDDGIKVWLNGAVVWNNDVYRGLTVDGDRTSISLNAGWNRLLVKVTQSKYGWRFMLKLCDSPGNAIPGLVYATAPADTTAPVISNLKITPEATSAVVEWDTDEPATTDVDYGTTEALGTTYTDDTLVKHHVANLMGLDPDTTYYIKVSSQDAAANVMADGPYTFQTTVTAPAPTSTYIRSWLLNGYYPNGSKATLMSTDYLGGEADVTPLEGSTSGGKTWFRADSSTDLIDLAAIFNNPTYCAAYACAYVYSSTARTVNMWMGSDDGIKVWLNGAVVWNNDVYRGLTVDGDRTSISLNAGWNRLLVKVTQSKYGWRFMLKLCDSSGNAIPGLVYALSPGTVEADTSPPIISNVVVTPDTNSAIVEWDTNEPGTTYVGYGLTADLGEEYVDESALVTHHVAMINGLAAGTTYYLKVGSADQAWNVTWSPAYTVHTIAIIPTPTSTYIRSWLLNGYYPNGSKATLMSTDYLGGEADVTPLEGSTSGGKTWFRADSSTDLIDLAAIFNNPTYCAAYACAYVYSSTARTVNMWMGSDDGIKVWLNGAVVWNNDVYRGLTVDGDRTSISLNAGWNRLLVKVTQSKYGWRFMLKLCDSSGNAIPGLYY